MAITFLDEEDEIAPAAPTTGQRRITFLDEEEPSAEEEVKPEPEVLTTQGGRKITFLDKEPPASVSRLPKLPEAPKTPEFTPEEPSESFLRPLADPFLNIGAGINDVVKGFADAFGANNAVSQNLAKNSEWYRSLLSAGAKEDTEEIGRIMQEAEGQGVLAEIGAGLKALTVAPVDLVSQGIGSLIPFIATAGVGKAVGLSRAGVAVLQGVQGGAVGGGIVKGEIYDAVKEQLINSGVDEAKAEKAASEAQAYNGKNLDQIMLGTGLGIAASATGAEGAIRSLITRKVGQEAAEQVSEQAIQEVLRTGFVRGAVKDGIVETATEALQGGQERLAANVAVGREGFDVEPMRGVFGQATLEGAIGGVLGGAAGGISAKVEQLGMRESVALRDAAKAADEAKQNNAPASAAAVEEQIEQTLEETPEQKVTRLQEEATAAAGIELEGEGGAEPTVPTTPPVAPTPEGAVAPVEPVVEPVVAEPQPAAEVVSEAEVAPEVTPTPETIEPLRRVARAEQAPEDIPSLVEAGLVEVYKDQPVLTDAGLAALPEAERPRLTPEARKIQIDTGSNEVVAEAISKNLRIGVDQVGLNVTLPAGWTLDGDIYVPPPAPEVRESRREPAPQLQEFNPEILTKKADFSRGILRGGRVGGVGSTEGLAISRMSESQRDAYFANQDRLKDLVGENARFQRNITLTRKRDDQVIASEKYLEILDQNSNPLAYVRNGKLGIGGGVRSPSDIQFVAPDVTVEITPQAAPPIRESLREPAPAGSQVISIPDPDFPEKVSPKEYHKLNSVVVNEYGDTATDVLKIVASMKKRASAVKEQIYGKKFLIKVDGQELEYNTPLALQKALESASDGAIARVYKNGNNQIVADFEDVPSNVERAFREESRFAKREPSVEMRQQYAPKTEEEQKAFDKASSNKVLARSPQLAVAAVRMKNGEITAGEYADLVDAIDPFTAKGPDPIPTDEKIKQYIQSDKVGKVGLFDEKGNARLQEGSEYEFRIDIPTYNRSTTAGDTVYAITAHLPVADDSKTVGEVAAFTGIAKVTDPRFMTRNVREGGAITIAAGAGKFRLATVKGNYEPITDLPADINDPNVWTEVGYNPVRSSFFVDTRSKDAVVGGSEAIMVGSRVFVKDAVLEPRPTGVTMGERYAQIQMPRPSGMEPEAVATKLESLGFGRGGIVSVVNQPDASFEGRTIIRDGKVVGIELNAAALKDDAAVERVLNHEIAESANADGALNNLVAGLTPKERKEINDAITRLGYAERARTAEEAARAVELLAEGWRGRRWFERAVARIEAWANKLGYKLTRRAAEYIAARNVSEINEEFKQSYNQFITPSSQEGAVIRESRREDTIPTFSEGSPEASTLSTMAASMAKVDAASEGKPNHENKPTYKISEIASVWMDQGGDARQLQDMVTEYTNLTPANAKKVANAIAKQYGLQQGIAEAGAVIAEPAPEVEGAPRKTSVQRLIEQAVGVRRPIVKLEVNEKTALKQQIILKAREARETRKARKEAARELAEAVTQYVKDNQIRGPVRARQTISLAKQALKLDVNNEKAVDRYIMYVERVVENANYDKDLSDAKALRKRAKEMAKKKTIGPEQKKVLEAIGNINPSLLDNPFEYNVLTERYLLGFLPVTSARYSVMPDAEARQYLESLEEQMKRNQAELDRAELERFFEARVDFAQQRGLTMEEAERLLNEDEDIAPIIQDYDLEKRKATEEMLLNLAQNAQKTLKTYDDTANTARQKELISFMQKVKLESITSDEKKRFIRFANNILANGETFGVEQFEAVAKAQERLVEASKDKRLTQRMNAWIGPLSGGTPAEMVQKLSLITQSEADTLKNIFGREAVGVFRRFLGLLDLDVAQTASTTAKEKVANKVGEFYRGLKKKYGEAAVNLETKTYATAAGYFIQAEGNKTQEESIAYRRRLWTENIEELRKSQRREDLNEADNKQKALEALTGNSNAEILNNLKAANPAAYEQLMWWKDQMHPEHKPFLKDHVENFRNQANNYDNVDYLSIHYKWDQSPELPSDLETQEFDDPVSFRLKQAANSVKRKEHQSLPVNTKTGVKANIDVNFGYNQYNALTEQLEKAYTAPYWEAVAAFVRDPLFNQVVGGKANADFIKNILRNIKATRTRKAMLDDENQIIGGTVALARRVSTQATLGGFTQPLRQVPDQLIKLIFTTGRIDLITQNFLNTSEADPLFNKLPISRRGDARAGSQFAAEFNEQARKVEASVTNKQWTKYKELMTQMGELWMTPLRASDVWIAKVSWMTYYEAELNKRDIKMESWEREAELFETDQARQEAAAQAEYLVDFYAGASDPTKMAALSKQGNNGWREFAKLIFLSLNSFALQQKSALISDARDLMLRTGDRKAALAGIAGIVGGMIAFHGMRIFIIGGLVYPAAMMVLKGIFGIDMDEPDEEEQDKQLRDNWRKMKASIYSNIVAGGAGQFLEGKSIDAFNRTMYLWDAHINPDEMMDDKGEFISFSKYEKEKSPFYRFRSYEKSEFTFGLADVLSEQAERSVTQTAQLLSDEEMSIYTGNEQAYAYFATGVEWAYFFRFMDTDLKRITTKLKNDIDKQAKEREAELRAIRNR